MCLRSHLHDKSDARPTQHLQFLQEMCCPSETPLPQPQKRHFEVLQSVMVLVCVSLSAVYAGLRFYAMLTKGKHRIKPCGTPIIVASGHEYYARHEMATAKSEQLIFDNIAAVRDDKPGSINPEDLKAARLNAEDEDRRIGTAIMLRVMPGDQFTFATDAYYEADEEPKDYEHTNAEEIVSSLLATLSGGTVGGKPVSETPNNEIINEMFTRPENISAIEDIINNSTTTGTAPRAGLNYLFFDKNMNLLSGSSRLAVGPYPPGFFENMSTGRVTTTEPGFVVVYVDNQTMGKDVWFDNVQVLHYNTQVLEENHYYPFGLTTSVNAMGITPQPLKYQTKELERSFGLEVYDFHARQYDPQLGRFNSIDPHADRYTHISPYGSMNNSPINYVDPNGKDYRVGYHQDEKGNTTITLSSTIYVRGYDQSNKVKEYNQYLKDNPQLLSNSTKNEDGTTTTVNIEMEYVEATQDDVVRLTNPETRNGDNLMNIKESEERAAASPITRKTVDPITGEITKEKITDFKAVIGGLNKGTAQTAFHENMHLFGLRDWYKNRADQNAVGFYDIMNNDRPSNTKPIMHQIHWNNWIQGVNQQRKQNGGLNNFNSNRLVE